MRFRIRFPSEFILEAANPKEAEDLAWDILRESKIEIEMISLPLVTEDEVRRFMREHGGLEFNPAQIKSIVREARRLLDSGETDCRETALDWAVDQAVCESPD